MMQNTAAWGTSLFTFPNPIGFSTPLDDRGTASATVEDGGLAHSANPAQAKGTCQRAGLCGQAGARNAWSPCREPDALGPARDAAMAVPPLGGVIGHLNAIPRRAVRGLGGDALRLSAIRPRGGELWAIGRLRLARSIRAAPIPPSEGRFKRTNYYLG